MIVVLLAVMLVTVMLLAVVLLTVVLVTVVLVATVLIAVVSLSCVTATLGVRGFRDAENGHAAQRHAQAKRQSSDKGTAVFCHLILQVDQRVEK